MPCSCKPGTDARALCLPYINYMKEWTKCPMKLESALFRINNDSDLHRRAIKGDFSFLQSWLCDDKEDIYHIIHCWVRDWLETEYDCVPYNPDAEAKQDLLGDALKKLKESREQNVKAEHVINYHKKLYELSLTQNVVLEKMVDEYKDKESLYKQRLEDIKIEIDYYKQKIKNESLSSGHSVHSDK